MSAGAGNITANVIGTQITGATDKHRAAKRKRKAKMKGNALVPEQEKIQEMLKEAVENDGRWVDFINAVSDQIIMSDKKLQKIIDGMHKAQEDTINKAVKLLESKFTVTGMDFKISGKAKFDEALNNYRADVKFVPQGKSKGGAKSFTIAITFDDDIPTVYMDSETKAIFTTQMREEAASQIRGALIMVADKHMSKLDQAKKAVKKLNVYMDGIEKRIQKIISDLPLMDAKILKAVLKAKYKKI